MLLGLFLVFALVYAVGLIVAAIYLNDGGPPDLMALLCVRPAGRAVSKPQSFPERTSRRDGQNLNDADGQLATLRPPGLWQRHQVRNTD